MELSAPAKRDFDQDQLGRGARRRQGYDGQAGIERFMNLVGPGGIEPPLHPPQGCGLPLSHGPEFY